MPQPLPKLEYKNLQTGLITEGAVAEARVPIDAVTEVNNMHFDRIGCATVRKGLTQLGDTLSGNILGLFEFRDSGSGTNNQILLANSTTVKYLSGSTWTNKRTGLTAGKTRFSTYLDFVFMVNGTDATAIWDGNTGNNFLTTGNAANAPIGKYIENFRSRMWIAGNATYPDRLYYSSIPSSVTTPIITWDTDVNTGQWIDISPSDGENITALKRTQNSLLVFKNNHIYRVYSISETEPDPKINVGTYSQESVVEAKDGVYFHHPSGFYRFNGGSAQEISRPIIDFVNAITLSNYTSISGSEDGDHVSWSIGDVTVNGVSYPNAVARFTISTETWTIYTYPTQFLCSSKYNDGTTLYNLVGDESGHVYKLNVGTQDGTADINYSLTHRWYNLDGLSSTYKNIDKIMFLHKGGTNTSVAYQIQDDETNSWSPLGTLKSVDTLIKDKIIKGRRCRFRIFGVSKGEPFSYNGFEIVNSTADNFNG